MKLLAIDTATEACSVALAIEGAISERFEIAPRQHTGLLLPWIDALLAEAGISRRQLDLLAVGRGPGAFTGVRLAVAVVQGIALGLDRPVVPVSSLAALAMRAPGRPGSRVLAAIDARMGEIYLGAFELDAASLPLALDQERLLAPAAPVVPAGGGWIGVGSGFAAAEGALQQALGPALASVDAEALPHAADIARIALAAYARGEALAADQLEPAYLRDKVAQTLIERGRGPASP